MKKALIHRKTDPAVFKGGIAGKTATILIHQSLLSGHEALKTVRRQDNARGSLRYGGWRQKSKLICGKKEYFFPVI
ncbi:TPA: hypothetical protein G9F27_005842 [Salmonella enterica]|uniref:Uncharacterized protein n=1 Tax=Salmonella enterica TaxID=28901 RepID=A0A743PIB5_SALER|nr:hypothetical protein [Salmonella enterica]